MKTVSLNRLLALCLNSTEKMLHLNLELLHVWKETKCSELLLKGGMTSLVGFCLHLKEVLVPHVRPLRSDEVTIVYKWASSDNCL